ncbi:MAG TPA: tetratricopeptide repeat protein, partial [Xanthomonadaceae bacterium]|nr:tetratricopeptide repeat protein [Xanthomonadaceae bacterium]
GFAHLQLGAYDDAQAYLQRAAQAYATLGDGTGRVRTSQNLGLLHAARGRLEEARTILQRSLADAQSQQMPEEAAVSYRNLAELDLVQGDVNSVLQHAQQAETLFAERGGRRGVVDVGLLRAQAWLAAGAYGDVSRVLDGLRADLASASLEQQAIAQLLEHELQTQRGDAGKAQAALREARLLSARSGVRHLQLQAELRGASAGELQRLDAATAAHGHAQLRLQWIEAALRQALVARDFPAASKLYREATALLRDGDYAHSWAVHRMGARALAGSGQSQAAADAKAAADAALGRMRKRIPQQARAGFDRMTIDASAVVRR